MTTIKATCPTCGDVDLTPEDVIVTIASELGWSTYTFVCANCCDSVCKPADDDIVQLLTGAGVRVERIVVPLEYVESRTQAATSRPITSDEILDFALWLGVVEDVVTEIAGSP